MTEKLHAFVCDTCSKCSAIAADGYPVDNKWLFVYHPYVAHFCSFACKYIMEQGTNEEKDQKPETD